MYEKLTIAVAGMFLDEAGGDSFTCSLGRDDGGLAFGGNEFGGVVESDEEGAVDGIICIKVAYKEVGVLQVEYGIGHCNRRIKRAGCRELIMELDRGV